MAQAGRMAACSYLKLVSKWLSETQNMPLSRSLRTGCNFQQDVKCEINVKHGSVLSRGNY